MFEDVLRYLQYYLFRLNSSTFFAGLVMITLNIGSRYIELKLDPSTETFLKNALSKEVLVFAVSWMGTRDLVTALILTAVFVILADYGLNSNSRFCILPQKYRNTQNGAEMNQDGLVSDKEINDAMLLLEKAKKQREQMKNQSYVNAFRSANN